ncbi:hypothetical protein CKK33_18660 [Mucilaginibacter sp. MD40]|uniref:hypothetical protein n=1 Tax=Mucilaginibacter sp. MD40 TaxID=2029590 RepID=UPI000BACA72C|nr:hypothetical protein [Mucilaginibacter sp. MD40]PAW95411.1 hypothetical protein CKK33_18660 [Mucilaginibacter sp. MD40]
MKKLKISMLALVFAVGVGGAFVQKIQAAPKANDPTYNWTHFNQSGSPIGSLPNATVDQARDDLGCPGSTSVKCATATGAPTIYYN